MKIGGLILSAISTFINKNGAAYAVPAPVGVLSVLSSVMGYRFPDSGVPIK